MYLERACKWRIASSAITRGMTRFRGECDEGAGILRANKLPKTSANTLTRSKRGVLQGFRATDCPDKRQV